MIICETLHPELYRIITQKIKRDLSKEEKPKFDQVENIIKQCLDFYYSSKTNRPNINIASLTKEILQKINQNPIFINELAKKEGLEPWMHKRTNDKM